MIGEDNTMKRKLTKNKNNILLVLFYLKSKLRIVSYFESLINTEKLERVSENLKKVSVMIRFFLKKGRELTINLETTVK